MNYSNVEKFENLKKFISNKIGKKFYQDAKQCKQNLVPFQTSRNDSNKVKDLMIWKNHCGFIEHLHIFLGTHISEFVCTRWLSPN